MDEERIFDLDERFALYRSTAVTDEIVRFLEDTAFGTKENLYRHFYIREYVANNPSTEFFFARDRQNNLEMVGLVALCSHSFEGNPPYTGIYIRYFAASPKIKGQKIVGRLSKDVIDYLRKRQETPAIFYGTVEGRNKASKAIADHLGFQFYAPLTVTGFSRFFPKKNTSVHRISAEEWKDLLPKLDALYSDYAFWTHDCLNLNNDYYVLKKNGKIVCGVQAHPGHWVVEKMPGFAGKYIVPLVPYVPLLRNVFNPKAFHFLNFEGIYFEKGHEADLVELFEGVLHSKGYHSALILLDERDPLYKFLLEQGKLGLLARFTAGTHTTFAIDFTRYPEKEAALKDRLCYAKGYDYI